jgi:hypothetical protein
MRYHVAAIVSAQDCFVAIFMRLRRALSTWSGPCAQDPVPACPGATPGQAAVESEWHPGYAVDRARERPERVTGVHSQNRNAAAYSSPLEQWPGSPTAWAALYQNSIHLR